MSSKKKFTIAIASVAFLAVAAVVALVTVLATFNATVTNSITVSYTAVNVHATISCEYGAGSNATTLPTLEDLYVKDSTTETEITFDATDTDEDKTKYFEGIETDFSRTNRYIFVQYTITNDDVAANAFSVTLTNGLTASNATVDYKVDSGDYATLGTSADLGSLAGKTTMVVTVRMSLTTATQDASVTGSLSFLLAV